MDENPSLVQEARNRRASSIPVVLIHDGGGTAFGYYILGELHPARELWAIRNPDYNRSKPYSMTMEEMARNYIRMIESSGIRGPIYLGGEHCDRTPPSHLVLSVIIQPTDTNSVQDGHSAAFSPLSWPMKSPNPPPPSPSPSPASSSLSLHSIVPKASVPQCALWTFRTSQSISGTV